MAEWDVLVVGAGSNGLVLAGELAARGVRVLALEARLEAGGLLTTEECSVHGYWHNMLGGLFNAFEATPPYRLLDLGRENARYRVPPVQAALPLRDGRAVIFTTDVEATCCSLASLSARDAQTYRALCAGTLAAARGSPADAAYAPPPGAADGVLPFAGALPAELRRYAALSPRQVAAELFESPQVQAAALQQLVVPWGILPDYAGMGAALLLALAGTIPLAVALGGAHVTAQALIRALVRRGGRYQVLKPVRRILVEDGAAVGVALADGSEIHARAVVSSGGLAQTLLDLVGPDALAPELAARVRGFQLDEHALFGVHLALARAPDYLLADRRTAARAPSPGQGPHNLPLAGDALRVFIGGETPEELDVLWRDVRAGALPEPRGMTVIVPSLFDGRQAPRGHHTAVLLQPAPYAPGGSADAWDDVREEYAARCVAAWRQYAQNLSDADILACVPLTPKDVAVRYANLTRAALGMGRMTADQAGANRPLPALADYRTPIRGLYLCGTCMYPGPGWLGAAGHNAAQVVMQDLASA
ncbi:MAG TPA: NAD(P)/FAD-dependent oxidoreductase [Chloroflexota bacterium]|nr:NAD(P)/FAD-dependent oxidoreductase [Chloroflexota bacterium]